MDIFGSLINKPIGWLLGWISSLVGGYYVWAIIIFAVLVEILMLPFAIKQQKTSIKQAKLRPKEMAIRKKYAGRDDKPTQQKMTQEIQELYQKEGYNPLGGCLPMLIQMILLFSLYAVIIDPLTYATDLTAEAILQIKTIVGSSASGNANMALLSAIEGMGFDAFKNVSGFTKEMFESLPTLKLPLGKITLDFAQAPSACMNLSSLKTVQGWVVLSIPVVTFFAYFGSMKLTKKLSYQPVNNAQQDQMGCAGKVMDIAMPLFSVFIAFSAPAALGFYWIFKCLLGMLKQTILYFAMPLPKFTEEDFKAAEKELAVKNEKNTKVAKSGKVVRSLHHIDDEDFEDTAEAGRLRREALEAQEAEEKARREASGKRSFFFGTEMKKDDREEKTETKAETASEEAEETAEKTDTDNNDNA